ncbi:MAG: DUF3300 domain-containing protein [Sulfurimicrobium sp.]|nr:DUF3300 domain-containing protein [Sulfurimicrobium sp.]
MLNISRVLHGEEADRDGGGCPGNGGDKLNCDSPVTWKVLSVVIAVAIILMGWMLTRSFAVAAEASAVGSAQAPMPQEKLDSLLAPIALYPDQLLTQTLMASTYPLDVVAAARFVKENRGLKGDALDKAVAGKNWDPSVQSLAAFPQVLEMMNDKLEWTQELGDAFLADEKRVMQTVQSLRQKAEAAGNLKGNEQVKVVKEQSTIIIEPARTEVVYVPTYNPTVVYGTWWAPMYPPYYYPPPPYYYPPGSVAAAGLIGFGLGIAIANNNHWGWCNTNWHGGSVNINVNKNNTFINNNAEFKNKVNNGNWQHNPSQRKGVAYSNAGTRAQYSKADPNAVSARRDARGYEPTGARGSAATRDVQRPSGGTSATQSGGISGTRDEQGMGGRDFNRSSDARPSFDAGQSRQQAQSFSNRGATSRASMGGSGGGRRGR